MEELEISLEDQMETIHHHAEHTQERWLLWCALISAVLAVSAAISGLYASHYANEAMLEQMHATDHWGYYQAKGIKAMITEMRSETAPSAALKEKLEAYKKEQERIREQASEEELQVQILMHKHELLAKAVTAFQVAIAVTAMSAITRRKHFLWLTFILALLGIFFSTGAVLVGSGGLGFIFT